MMSTIPTCLKLIVSIDINIFFVFYRAMEVKKDCKLVHEALRAFMQFVIISFVFHIWIKAKNNYIKAWKKHEVTTNMK